MSSESVELTHAEKYATVNCVSRGFKPPHAARRRLKVAAKNVTKCVKAEEEEAAAAEAEQETLHTHTRTHTNNKNS